MGAFGMSSAVIQRLHLRSQPASAWESVSSVLHHDLAVISSFSDARLRTRGHVHEQILDGAR